MERILDDVVAVLWRSTAKTSVKCTKMLCKRKIKRVRYQKKDGWSNEALVNYIEYGKNTEFDMMAQKADNVEGQWWGWLAGWKILAAMLLIKWKIYTKGWEEDDKGNYLYCFHTHKKAGFHKQHWSIIPAGEKRCLDNRKQLQSCTKQKG